MGLGGREGGGKGGYAGTLGSVCSLLGPLRAWDGWFFFLMGRVPKRWDCTHPTHPQLLTHTGPTDSVEVSKAGQRYKNVQTFIKILARLSWCGFVSCSTEWIISLSGGSDNIIHACGGYPLCWREETFLDRGGITCESVRERKMESTIQRNSYF